MKKTIILASIIILLSFIVGIFLYSSMPEKMASHWDLNNEVNGYMSKFLGLFIMPMFSLILFLLFLFLPKIDPMRKNIKKFQKYYDIFILIIIIFFFYMHLMTILWNFGLNFNMSLVLIPSLAILFFYCGILIEKSKRNWFIGIRTPWTLASDEVWHKTHQLGGKLFKISALILLFGLIFKNYAFLFILVPIVLSSVYLTVYSYFQYRLNHKKIKKRKK
jgi:uncharacterized membrane protein